MKRFSAISMLLFAALFCCVPAIALACYPCVNAHEHDDHICSPDNCIGYYWTVPYPGKCRGGGATGCNEDGTTNVTVHKRKCYEEVFGTDCYNRGGYGSREEEVSDCY